MALVINQPFINDGTPTTFVTDKFWEPYRNVQNVFTRRIQALEKYINSIFPNVSRLEIYLTTDCAFLENDLIALYPKVCVKEKLGYRKQQNTLFSLRNINLKVSPLAFYRFAETNVVDILKTWQFGTEHKASARKNAVFGLSHYKGVDYIHNLLKLHDLLNSRQELIFKYELEHSSSQLFELNKDSLRNFVKDELGEVFADFNGIGKLKPNKVPFLGQKFKLVGTQYYAKDTRDGLIHCILYAEEHNPHEDNAVKVLRWFPEINNIAPISNCFFALGYISCQENKSLHKFMVEKKNRILFGEIEHGIITIVAGIMNFQDTSYSFPINLIKNV